NGTHTYTNPGSYAVGVQISHNQGFTTPATTGSTATVVSLGQPVQRGMVAGPAFWAGAGGQAMRCRFALMLLDPSESRPARAGEDGLAVDQGILLIGRASDRARLGRRSRRPRPGQGKRKALPPPRQPLRPLAVP